MNAFANRIDGHLEINKASYGLCYPKSLIVHCLRIKAEDHIDLAHSFF